MKKTLLLFFIILISIESFAFERETPEIVTIGEELSFIEGVTGYMKLPEGSWTEREGRIPRYISNDFVFLQDNEDYSLGTDNFQKIELRELKQGGNEYYMLFKHYTNGSYKYPSIEEDWSYWYYVDAYVLKKEDLPDINLKDREAQLIKINLVTKTYVFFISQRYEDNYIRELSDKLSVLLSEKDLSREKKLIINVMKIDNKVRFLLLERKDYIYDEYISSIYSGLEGTLPLSEEEMLTEEVFRNFYYETDYNYFKEFWSIN